MIKRYRFILPTLCLAYLTFRCGQATLEDWKDLPELLAGWIGTAVWVKEWVGDAFPTIRFTITDWIMWIRNTTARIRIDARVSFDDTEKDWDWSPTVTEVVGIVRQECKVPELKQLGETARTLTFKLPQLGTLMLDRVPRRGSDRPMLIVTFDDLAVGYQEYRAVVKDHVVPLVSQLIGLKHAVRETFGYDVELMLKKDHPFVKYLRDQWEPAISDILSVQMNIGGQKDQVEIIDRSVQLHGKNSDRVLDSVIRLLGTNLAAERA